MTLHRGATLAISALRDRFARSRMALRGRLLAAAAPVMLAACMSPSVPYPGNMAVVPAPTDAPFPQFLAGAMCVGDVTGWHGTTQSERAKAFAHAFGSAVTQSLASHQLLATDGCRYQVNVVLLDEDTVIDPTPRSDLRLASFIAYKVTGPGGTTPLWKIVAAVSHSASFLSARPRSTPGRPSPEDDLLRANIAAFLDGLRTLKL